MKSPALSPGCCLPNSRPDAATFSLIRFLRADEREILARFHYFFSNVGAISPAANKVFTPIWAFTSRHGMARVSMEP
jgi:hypothetical protein